ncbi:MAG TPA: HNH endonuclease signature motif containing protein [Acidimicrobiales bacterium]|nr:HNH endonuclease signature motif containing protein [Acidimicrobiales bacterium]
MSGCVVTEHLELDHIWRGSLLAAVGWSPSAINDPANLQLLCAEHHRSKTQDEQRLLAAEVDRDSSDGS